MKKKSHGGSTNVVNLFQLIDCHVTCFLRVCVYVSHSVLAFLLHDVLGVLQHLLLPQVKEVGGISVKLQGLLPIIPADIHLQTLELHLGVSYTSCYLVPTDIII